ncbi:MAG: Hsp70 family protein [Myxococcales bacterium FL481]|nr:MAG: Hsp70 family protein [Myxococcales bacterium FL481]
MSRRSARGRLRRLACPIALLALQTAPPMAAPSFVAGVDFGTSNTAIAVAGADPTPRVAAFTMLQGTTPSFRSLLFFDPDEQVVNAPVNYHAGPDGIEAYLDALGEGRLIQSFKTHLTATSLGRTQIGPHALDLDQLLILFLRRFRDRSEAALQSEVRAAVFGRPVQFAGADETADSDRAQRRLEQAGRAAGFDVVSVELEPIAAAYHHEQRLDREELALVADFGGGTTDFCVMRLGPAHREQAERQRDILATGGIGIAGDNLDAAIIENLVAPALGKGSCYREMGKRLPIPASYYHKLSHWHQLSFLRSARTRSELERLAKLADKPDAIEALMELIEDNQGFYLHKSVETAKIAISTRDETEFVYDNGGRAIRGRLRRADFDRWVADDVAAIAGCLDATLERAGLRPEQVGQVFMTGGTAFVPCIRGEFERRFGREKLAGGDELLSIASGLALRGRQAVRG